MSEQLKRLQERRDEITADMTMIESTAGGFNRKMSSGELSRRKALATDLRAISKKITASQAADDLLERIAQATPVGIFDF